MLPATVKKTLADLTSSKARSLLVVLSIALGVFAVGTVASAFAVVKQDMAADYEAANPHTARIYSAEFDDTLVETLATVPGVEAAEARYNLWVKVAGAGGREYPINLDSVASLPDTRVDQLIFESGATSLAAGEIALERQGAAGLGLAPGDEVGLILNDGRTVRLRLAGTVHDVIANPFNFSSQTSGYVTPATMVQLGGSNLSNFVSLVTSGSHTDAVHIREIADRVAAVMAENGVTVYNINITNPGQHPAQSIIDTVLLLLGALTALVIFLSAFLVTNTVAALMGQQIRQIGVMKAVGATMGQVVSVYLGLLLAFGAAALLIAVPLAGLAAWGLSGWLIGMLNATASPFGIPAPSLGLQLFVGLAVPVLGGLVPVIGGARLTVRQAITSYGVTGSGKPGLLDRLLDALPWLPRPALLSLRNAFRRKARLSMTLLTLTLGGAVLIAMLGVRESLYLEIDQSFGYYQADVNVELARPYPLDDLLAATEDLPGVTSVEGWGIVPANVPHASGESSDQVIVHAPPAGTRLVHPVMIEGRWLLPSDANAIVVSNHLTALRPDIGPGDTLVLRLDGTDTPFTVVGVFRMAGTYSSPYVYVPYDALATIAATPGQVNNIKIVTSGHDIASQQAARDAVETRLKDGGFEGTAYSGGEILAQQRSQIDILIALLLALGALIAAVGGLGLMGTMGMNVLERTREIGVMRSIGASSRTIFQMVVLEGTVIGLIAWILGALMAVPITHLLGDALGTRLMTLPLLYLYSAQGALLWLLLALGLAAIASLLPARNATRLTVRQTLAYE